MQQTIQPIASSYRDPSGFMFEKNGHLYRQVNKIFKDDFDLFIRSGCYDHLVKNHLLVPHQELSENLSGNGEWYKTLEPAKIPFISYPYEWCFDMIKDAALLTLQLVKEVIPYGMMLKDASPYNIQWLNGKLVFIDTLSFEKYDPLKPWIAYRQFCENFLSPLLLMRYSKQPLQPLLLSWPDGIPVSVTRSLLPGRSKFSFHTYLHIHLHGRLAAKSTGKGSSQPPNFSEKKLQHLIGSLQSLIQSLKWKGKPTAWENYYDEASRRSDYLPQKKTIVEEWINQLPGIKTAGDFGANDGEFSYLLAKNNIQTIATDLDHSAINKLYTGIKKETHDSNTGSKNILPLIMDLASPSPAIGLNNQERLSFIDRTKIDLALGLAVIHHLVIGKNIPFEKLAEFFASISNYLLIEFVPKEDEKVQFMLRQKKDIYPDYNEERFIAQFSKRFSILKKQEINQSKRILYLMKNEKTIF